MALPIIGAVSPALLLALLLGGVAAAVSFDRLLQVRAWVVWGFVAAEAVDLVAASLGTFAGVGPDITVRTLGPVETAITIFVCVFALARPADRPGGGRLYIAAWLYLGTAITTDLAVIGTTDRTYVIMLLVFSALWLARELPTDVVVLALKVIAGAILVLSLIAWLVGAPTAAHGYDGLLPLPVRVSGILGHPNNLAPIALLALLLERLRPSSPSWRPLMVVAATVVLLVAQSKTTWVMAVFALATILTADVERRRRVQVIGLLSVAAVAVLVWGGIDTTVALPSEELEDITTLTGRVEVWAVGVETWSGGDRLLGQGSGVFREYAARSGREWAGQAHNQVVQTIAEHGVVGVVGLVVYASALLHAAGRHRSATGGVSLGLVGSLLLQTMTETPLDAFGVYHFATVALLFAWSRERGGHAVLVPRHAALTSERT